MRSFQSKPNRRRQIFLKLSSSVEGQLREVYARLHEEGALNQSDLAEQLGVNRSVIHRRLSGKSNMTLETVADLVWALGQDIEVKIFDPEDHCKSNFYLEDVSPVDPERLPQTSSAGSLSSSYLMDVTE